VIVVERVYRRQVHDRHWRNNYRPVVVYYRDGRYYDHALRGWPMREIVVYERDGRYYSECDDRDDRWSDQRRDRDYDEDRNWD